MPYAVETAFDEFRANIELSGDHRATAISRRDHLVSLLEGTFQVLQAFPTGSIPRYTAVTGHADLDVMVVLHYGKHAEGKNPSQVLRSVRDCLAERKQYTNVRRNGQAVTLYYATWPNVDIVPVFYTGDSNGNMLHYNVPDMHRETWLVSKPWVHDREMTEHNTACGERFKRLVKMFKWWNHEHGGLLQSFHVEVITMKALTGQLSDYSWHAHWMFEQAYTFVGSPLYHNGDLVDGYLDDESRRQVLEKLRVAKERSLMAWCETYGGRTNHEQAISLWREVFGDKFPAYG